MRSTVLALGLISAQGAQSQPSFEAVAVHRNTLDGANSKVEIEPSRLSVRNQSLRTLILTAYGLATWQLTGGPGWVETDTWDIEATLGSSVTVSKNDMLLCLRTLLAGRFHLQVHTETREATVYGLYIDKAGARLRPSSEGETLNVTTRKSPGVTRMQATAISMRVLAGNLGKQLGRLTFDQTGLTGTYDFGLEWDPDQNGESVGTSIFGAIKEQLGLRLKSEKRPVSILVIDAADRPSVN